MFETQSYKTHQEMMRRDRRDNCLACIASAAMIAAPVVAWAFGLVG